VASIARASDRRRKMLASAGTLVENLESTSTSAGETVTALHNSGGQSGALAGTLGVAPLAVATK